MPRYFFHVHDDEDLPDEDGTVLPDLAEAKKHAVTYAAALLLKMHETFWRSADWSMDVTDERGCDLFTLQFTATPSPSAMQH